METGKTIKSFFHYLLYKNVTNRKQSENNMAFLLFRLKTENEMTTNEALT